MAIQLRIKGQGDVVYPGSFFAFMYNNTSSNDWNADTNNPPSYAPIGASDKSQLYAPQNGSAVGPVPMGHASLLHKVICHHKCLKSKCLIK